MNVEDKQERWSQYFTPLETAEACRNWLAGQKCIEPRLHSGEYFFVEPSAGTGVFYSLMPWENRIAYEIDPELAAQVPGCITQDFLALELDHFAKLHDRRLIFIGNPPFGFRGKDALAFINKSFALGAEYVAFILPPAFVPDADGDPPAIEKRIEGGYSVAHMMVPKAFDMPVGHSGKDITGCAFVLYKKGEHPTAPKKKPNAGYTLRNVDGGPDLSDIYIPRVRHEGSVEKNGFAASTMPMPDSIGVSSANDDLLNYLLNYDWKSIARQSSNGSYMINQSDVKKVIAGAEAPQTFTLYNIGEANKKAGYCAWGLDKVDRCARFLPVSRRHGQEIKASKTKDFTSVIGIATDDKDLLKKIDELDWASVAKQSSNRNQCLNQTRVRKALMKG